MSVAINESSAPLTSVPRRPVMGTGVLGVEYADADVAALADALVRAWQEFDHDAEPTRVAVRARIEWAGVEYGRGEAVTFGPVALGSVLVWLGEVGGESGQSDVPVRRATVDALTRSLSGRYGVPIRLRDIEELVFES